MHQAKGFTLLELMITVAIVAILAGIALPSYSAYVLRSKFLEATGNLADLRIKMEQYYMDNRRYSAPLDENTCGIPGGNAPTVSDGRYFTYQCLPDNPNGLGAQTYRLTANGVAAQGLGGLSFRVNEANSKETQVLAGSDMEKAGFTPGVFTPGVPSATCWVRKKPAEC